MIKKLFYFLYFRYLISRLCKDFKQWNPMNLDCLFRYYASMLDSAALEGGFYNSIDYLQFMEKRDNLIIWTESQIAEHKRQQKQN